MSSQGIALKEVGIEVQNGCNKFPPVYKEIPIASPAISDVFLKSIHITHRVKVMP